MEREAIVRKLLSLGVMATPEILKKIETTGLDAFLEKTKKNRGMVIQVDEEAAEKLSCCVRGAATKLELTPDDIIQLNAEKYKRIRDFLLRKIEAVSINNIGRTNSKLSVVGMVKERTSQGFVLEDGTGEVEVRSQEKVELDDVVGVRGWVREKTLFGEEVVYPDIPMNRVVNNLDNTLLLAGEPGSQAKSADIVLTPLTVTDVEGNEKDIPNPAWIFLEKGNKKMAIIVYRPHEQTRKEDALAWLKKRYIGTDKIPAPSSERILETIPDILWVAAENEPWTENYKGVTLVSFGRGHHALIDLKTRKIEIA